MRLLLHRLSGCPSPPERPGQGSMPPGHCHGSAARPDESEQGAERGCHDIARHGRHPEPGLGLIAHRGFPGADCAAGA
jgi:hypothetical protein